MKYRLWTIAPLVGVTLLSPSTNASAASDGWELSALDVPAAHSISKGEGATVAVIDTGIRTDHPELKGRRVSEGPDFLDETDQDEPWYGEHGTSMAASALDVAPEARVLGLRAIRDDEDPDYKEWEEILRDRDSADSGSGVAQAIEHAVEEGVDVISMSLGGSEGVFSPYDTREASAIQDALHKGIVVLAASGNAGDPSRAGDDNKVSYPAGYPGVIAVAAAAPDGSRASFSTVHNYNDIAAPGVSINSADIEGGRSLVNGTSSATALTAGVAALIVSRYPDLAPRQVEQVLQRTASNGEQGHNALTGYGTINAQAALEAAGKLKPEDPALPVGDKNVDMHFGPGDDGTPRKVDVGRDPEYTMAAVSIGGPGLVAVVVGAILTISGFRARRRSLPGTG